MLAEALLFVTKPVPAKLPKVRPRPLRSRVPVSLTWRLTLALDVPPPVGTELAPEKLNEPSWTKRVRRTEVPVIGTGITLAEPPRTRLPAPALMKSAETKLVLMAEVVPVCPSLTKT